jgi:hypothetical protein
LDTNLKGKEDKKTAEAKPGTSPALSTPNSEDASMLTGLLEENGTDNLEDNDEEERSPDPNHEELLSAISKISPLNEDESSSAKQVDTVSTEAEQENNVITAVDLEDYIQVIQNNDSENRFWQDAKEFPDLTSVDPDIKEIDKYIEDVLAHSHKWKDQKDVKCTMDEIDLKDQMARFNCKYTQNLCLRLGKTRAPHLEVAKAHAASMKEAALAWQEKAIKSINDTAAVLQKDNKRVIRDIKSEASQETNELRRQLETLSKKHVGEFTNGIQFHKCSTCLEN